MAGYLVPFFLVSVLPSSLTRVAYNDMPWTQAAIHFNQIVDSVKQSSRDIWGFEIKIIESIKIEIKTWCKQGRIRVSHGRDEANGENVLGISTKNYVLTIPTNMDEEKYLWTLPAVQCRARYIEHLSDTVISLIKDTSVENTNTRSARVVKVRERLTNDDEKYHGEYDSSSSSEEDEETLEHSKKEKEMISTLEKQLLEGNRKEEFDNEDDNHIVNEEDSEKIETFKKEERERFLVLEVLVVGLKVKSAKNEDSKDLRHLEKQGGPTTDKHVAAIEEWKRETLRLEASRSSHDGSGHAIEEMDQDKLDKMNKEKQEHNQALRVAKIKRTKDKKEAQRKYVEENVRQSTIETMKRDKDHITNEQSRYSQEIVEEASSSESTSDQQPSSPDDKKKELFPARLSRHLTFRKTIKEPTTNY